MTELKVFHFLWERYNWRDLDLSTLTEPKHKGLYQIYGTHHVYGKDSLLYIGQTKDQNFGTRLDPKQHWDFNVNHFVEISDVYIGMLIDRDDGTSRSFRRTIDEVEYLLINSHCPAFNATNLKGMANHDPKNQFIAVNWGNFGSLLPEVSTLKYSNKYWDDSKYSDNVVYEK